MLGYYELGANRISANEDRAPLLPSVSSAIHYIAGKLYGAEWESALETAEIMADAEAMSAIRADMADPDGGEFISWDQLKRELGL